MYSILTIEMAINYWRVVAPSPDQVCLTPNVRVLAEVYGRMISERATEVARSTLDNSGLCGRSGRAVTRGRSFDACFALLVTNSDRRSAPAVTNPLAGEGGRLHRPDGFGVGRGRGERQLNLLKCSGPQSF
jgi:hypothetical protein